jgi:2-polyprenyl-3-methyl-5-hydroxy-6-metoxy-1,4-benzoquinol methylase
MENREYFEANRVEMLQFIVNRPNKCIEFGCSSGEFSALLKSKYQCETWGIDMDEMSIKKAKHKMDKVFLGDALEMMEHLPENFFDLIVCNDFIEHIPAPDQFFQKVRKHLAPGAILICSLPNVRHWKHFNRYLFLKDWKYKKSGILDYTHLRFFTKKSMRRSIRSWGFEIEKMKGLRPTKSPFFYLFNLLTLNFIGDMRFLQYGFRARFISEK